MMPFMAVAAFAGHWPILGYSPAEIVAAVFGRHERVLLFGPPGIGKSTLAAGLACRLAEGGRACWCIGADPGSPAFGLPGAVSLAEWRDEDWRVSGLEALCTLDAGRFRLPLVAAVRRLARGSRKGVMLVDGPGVVRGVAGSELLFGLAGAAAIDSVLALTAPGRAPPLFEELRALGAPVHLVQAHPAAGRPGKAQRARMRTARWDAYLAGAGEKRIDLAGMACSGTPPPYNLATVWVGRQIALLENSQTRALGEVLRADGNTLVARTPGDPAGATAVLVRDAARDAKGLLTSAAPFVTERLECVPVAGAGEEGGYRVMGRVGALDVDLVNGVFGDPLLHARLRFRGRSMLFDLGSGERLSARAAHQVTDVFISHAHIDHIAGFLWLLRSRIGDFPACRVYGPPGVARNIAGLMDGILWDRAGERAPRFEVAELHGDMVRRFALAAGRAAAAAVDEMPAPEGVLHEEPGFRVRATTLDHGTPVLAFAFEPDMQVNIRKDRLTARGLDPGPWLATLKQHVLSGDESARIALPGGGGAPAGELAADLALVTPGKKLVYATDLADTPANRQRLVALARHAHTFFCEAVFLEADAEQAHRTGHLTARACGEIAAAAEVARLVPFHFSRRYAGRPERVYAEVADACPRLVAPGAFGAVQGH
jgi:ribonuclease BN (tRNA processing enzyme)